MKKKVLVIGLDGATPNLLFPLAQQGELRNLQKIMMGGSWGELESSIPPVTWPAWVSSVTGVNPGKHGIHDFFLSIDIKNRRIDYANTTKRKVRAIWGILSDSGKRVVILNVPVTYPPEKVNGVMVSGMETPSVHSDFTYPREVKDELLDIDYRIDLGETLLEKELAFKRSKIGMVDEIEELVDTRLAAAKLLMNHYEWDLFMVVFVAPDRLQHFFWKYIDPEHIAYSIRGAEEFFPHLLRVFRKLDQAIGQLIESARASGGDVNTIIYSDHGFKPLNSFFFTNSLLRREGLLKVRQKPTTSILTQDHVIRGIHGLRLDQLTQKIPAGIRRKMGLLLPPSKDFLDVFDLSTETKAFQFGNGFININKDVVSTPEEFEKLKNELVRLFNGTLFSHTAIRAYKKEEIYHGPSMSGIPDVVLVPEKNICPTYLVPINGMRSMDYNENVRIPSLTWSGQHSQYGIVVCHGSEFQKDYKLEKANIADVAPSILKIMGDPIPHYMDGNIFGCFRT